MSNYAYNCDGYYNYYDDRACDIGHEYYEQLLNLALSRFEWYGLPDGITSRIIEKQIIQSGLVFFFKDTDGVYKCLRTAGTGNYNIYNEPTQYIVYGMHYQKTLNVDDGILIRNNPRNHGDENMLRYWADYMNEVQKTKVINLDVQKTPYIIKGDKTNNFTWKSVIKQISQYKRAIFLRKNTLKGDDLEALQLDAPYLLEDLQKDKVTTFQEALTFLGINSVPYEKKERLIVDEVNSNNDWIETNLQLMLEERKLSVELINTKYNLNISVRGRDYNYTKDVEDEGKEEEMQEKEKKEVSD